MILDQVGLLRLIYETMHDSNHAVLSEFLLHDSYVVCHTWIPNLKYINILTFLN